MLKEAIHHENFGIYAYPKTQNELNLRLRVAKMIFWSVMYTILSGIIILLIYCAKKCSIFA